VPQEKLDKLLRLALSQPPKRMYHWTIRVLAERVSLAPSTVQKILAWHGLKLHKVKTFKVSDDPQFEEKINDIVGLLVNPPRVRW